MFRLMSTRSVVTSLPSTTTPGSHKHLAAPVGHVLVGVVADVGIVERSPAAQQNAAPADLFITRQRFIEEIEKIVVQRHDLLHELHVLHQAHDIIGEELDGGNGSHAAGIERGRMHVAAFHQAEHLARHAAHLQRFAIERAGERIQRGHDIGDGAITVQVGVRSRGLLRLRPHAGIGLLHHLLAEIHAHQIVLENIVVEHVLGGFAEIDDPLAQRRRTHAERHVLRIGGAGGVVVAADSADPAGDEVRIARIFALHEDAIAAEDGGGAVAFGHLAIFEVDLGEDAQAAHDPGNRIPVHLHQLPLLGGSFRHGSSYGTHSIVSFPA